MTRQNLNNILIAVFLLLIVGVTVFWMNSNYQRMKDHCEKMGGKFYTISFTQNICVDGEVVHELK